MKSRPIREATIYLSLILLMAAFLSPAYQSLTRSSSARAIDLPPQASIDESASLKQDLKQTDASAKHRKRQFHLEIHSATAATLYYDPISVAYLKQLTFLDPASGESLTSTSLKAQRNESSISFYSQIEVNGVMAPATFTLTDQGSLIVTLPYSGGVLRGEGTEGKVKLERSGQYRDIVAKPGEQLVLPHEQEPQAKCLNCS